MLSLCVATLDLDGIKLPKNSQQAMKCGRNTSRTFEVEEPSGDVLEDLTYDYDAEAFVQRNEHQQKNLYQPPTVGSFNAPPTIEPMNSEVHSESRKRNELRKKEI
ncbi:hypothetical protein Syun_006955 [Stephania yunnanensis]|uniref:Uncharacterized protein n=1 Tax=Stephania yunnanensis TaxID=152371 RepID=A0AAP0PZU3_9MAGN